MMNSVLIPPQQYEKKLNTKELEKIKLDHTDDDGIIRSHSFPMFSGDGTTQGDAEAYLHCLSNFERFAKVLRLPVSLKQDKYVLTLSDIASSHYYDSIEPQLDTLPVPAARGRNADLAGRTALVQFAYTVDKMKTRFCGGNEARDRLVSYLRTSDEVIKNYKVSVEAHVGRILTLLNKANELPYHVQEELSQREKIQLLV